MNRLAARQILERFRPGVEVAAEDTELRTALELARTDAELGQWFRQHCEFQAAVTRKVRTISVPADLKARIKARQQEAQKVVAFPQRRWYPPAWLAAAAGLILCAALAGFWLSRERVPDSFADYRARMVRSVLREYHMDVRTGDLAAVRGFMKTKGAPDDFVIPGGLAKLELAGGGFLIWRNQPVSMICFNQGQAGMSYLFVLDRADAKDAPPTEPEIITVNGRSSAAWTSGNRIYLLTGAEGVDVRTLL
ncbi:MAG: hypothetical protein J0M24_00865 [Verrucomicrobia bacterium]|nr:hypothetical protein [Verrucomicrobiota bacterium]